ncbi:MAG: hypothetical protein ACOX2R_04210 [Anaerolineae bacterium]
MFDIVNSLFNLIDQHAIWLYLGCLLLALYYLRVYLTAHRDRTNTIFTIEKEMATHRQGRAMSGIGVALGIAAVITGVKYYVVPNVDVAQLAPPTPTMTFTPPTVAAPTTTPTPVTPTATPRPMPTTAPAATIAVVANPPEQPTAQPAVSCANPNVCITSPAANAVVSGSVPISGTAAGDRFQFFKIEYSQGETPSGWNVYGDLRRQPVAQGNLGTFNSTAFANGVYWLQLVVVDETGNFGEPHRIRIVIQND